MIFLKKTQYTRYLGVEVTFFYLKIILFFLFRLEAKKKLAELKEKFSLEDDFDDLDFGEDDSEENSDLEDTED